MSRQIDPPPSIRPLIDDEYRLARWMLENGNAEAPRFLEQLEEADATTWRCDCGCASFNFQIRGMPPAPPGVNSLDAYVFGTDDQLAGVMIYESEGILSGVEIYGFSNDTPPNLPKPSDLRPSSEAIQ